MKIDWYEVGMWTLALMPFAVLVVLWNWPEYVQYIVK